MKYWITVSPASADCPEPVYQIYSEKAVLAEYYDYWSSKMRSKNLDHQISEVGCIQDWVIINWAEPATKQNIEKILDDTVRENYI